MSESERHVALTRFRQLRPFLEEHLPLVQVARDAGIDPRTARRWATRYRKNGLAGLIRKTRSDKTKSQMSTQLQHVLEGLALKRPPFSIRAIHRQAIDLAKKLNQRPPSYSSVYALVRGLEPALLMMAHEGTKSYADKFDLVHRTEAKGPNAIWQADHTQLDIILNDRGEPRKPWLTIILDDYSRAVAGYALSFSAPSAIQTALALRQAIWRKAQPAWHICGIPQVLYTDHGSDFTSQHIEQVMADIKVQLIFSAVGRPRGRGKIERFFRSLSQVLLPRLLVYEPAGRQNSGPVSLAQLSAEIEKYLVNEYNMVPHSATGQGPQERWESGGFLPHMPDSLEYLDLLLLTVPKARRVRPDGIHFSGLRYIDPTLAAYVGEQVVLRYDPRDIAEIRVFHNDRFLCRAVCQDLAGETVPLREIVRARDRQRRLLRETLQDRQKTVDELLRSRRWTAPRADDLTPQVSTPPQQRKLKLYRND